MKFLAVIIMLVLSLLPLELQASGPVAPHLLVDNISWPESPLAKGKDLYYVAYGSHDVMLLQQGQLKVFWHRDGCGPAALAETSSGDFIVSCYDANELLRISATGETLQSIGQDVAGQGFVGPNDFAVDSKGGFYFTASGVFDPAAPVTGKIYYCDARGIIREVASNIHYANGLALTPDGETLLVAEHLAARILAFEVDENGELSQQKIWKKISDVIATPTASPATYGCDGLKIDRYGNVYITNYAGGRLLITDAQGKLLHVVEVPELYIDNVALGPDTNAASSLGEEILYISAVRNETESPYPGAIYTLRNPLVSSSRTR